MASELRAAVACVVLAAALSGAGVLIPRLSAKRPAFVRSEQMVAMRDGVKLQTVVQTPTGKHPPLPILLMRTPYGVPDAGDEPGASYDDLKADGYIFVTQNIRGRFKSEGTFVMQRPPRDKRDPNATDEGSDAYDTIAWLVANVAGNDGKVCVWGTSYPGWTTAMAMLDPQPALRCVSERAAMGDLFVNDDFHHQGAFRLSYGFEYSALLETTSEKNTDFDFGQRDLYDFYLALGALSHVDERYFHGKMPTWENFVAHPNRDDFWDVHAPTKYLTHTTVPDLNVAGWYDQEDFIGPMDIYASLEKTDDAGIDYLVVGPWNHGGWGHGTGESLGDIDFGSETAATFRANEQRRWFAHWLHDGPPLDLPEATIFETGSNTWRRETAWPPKTGVTAKRVYMRAGRALSFDAPADDDASDAYVSDPANPVPYRHRPIGPTYPGPEWPKWLVEDQRFVDHRPDVLTWETDVLDADVVIAGNVVAELYASTSQTDADWVVKLIDVLPDEAETKGADAGMPNLHGYELIVTSDILRGRFRDGFDAPKPVAAGDIVKYAVDLHTRAHAFKKGHRIMVQVQSTWFPLYDRNPQKYVENIFRAEDGDFVAATHKVFRSKDHASAIVLPVRDAVASEDAKPGR